MCRHTADDPRPALSRSAAQLCSVQPVQHCQVQLQRSCRGLAPTPPSFYSPPTLSSLMTELCRPLRPIDPAPRRCRRFCCSNALRLLFSSRPLYLSPQPQRLVASTPQQLQVAADAHRDCEPNAGQSSPGSAPRPASPRLPSALLPTSCSSLSPAPGLCSQTLRLGKPRR
jgi:hypothetical protein